MNPRWLGAEQNRRRSANIASDEGNDHPGVGMEELTGLDARFLYSETPTAHMHTLKIAVVDLAQRPAPLTHDDFVAIMADRLDRLPTLRRRAVPIPYGLGHPVWIEDPDFEIRQHLHWRRIDAPGSDRQLAEVIADVAGRQLSRDRPLWDLTVVEGLAGNRMAFVMKLHHSLADGGAAELMLENAFVLDDADAYVQPPRPEPVPSGQELLRHAARSGARRVGGLPNFTKRTVSGLTEARRARRRTDVDLPVPFSSPRTSLNRSLDAARTFAMTSMPLDDLLAVKRDADVTFNDVFLALCGGALRRHLARRGELPATTLVAGVPMATSAGGGHRSGNHVDNLMLPLGTDIAEPGERLRRIHDAAVAARAVREALGPELMEYRAGLTPPLYGIGIRLWTRSGLASRTRPPINLVASNVRGPDRRLGLDGTVMTELYSMGPILEGIGLNITAWSYVDRLHVSVLGCPASLPDPWALIDDLLAAGRELGIGCEPVQG